MDTAKITKRKAYTQDQVTQRYQDRFNIPILTAETYNKGIYKTFTEFKNNAPSITAFTMKNDLLYDSSNNLVDVLNIFGYCDGKICWIMRPVVRDVLNRTNKEINRQTTEISNDQNIVPTVFGDITFHPSLKKPRYDRAVLCKVGNSYEFEFLMPFKKSDNTNNSRSGSYAILLCLNIETGKID